MQSPWTRDGKVRAELVNIMPQVSGRIRELHVTDNQYVKQGDLLAILDDEPYRIAIPNAEEGVYKARADLAKAKHEARRRQRLPDNAISAEDLDAADLNAKAMSAATNAALAELEHARWNLTQTRITAPTNGWITNLTLRPGNYATSGSPLFALVDSHSFYIVGYFEEIKLRHIHAGAKAEIRLYSDHHLLQGEVESIGRAIYDQSVEMIMVCCRTLNLMFPGYVSHSVFRFTSDSIHYPMTLCWLQVPPAALQFSHETKPV